MPGQRNVLDSTGASYEDCARSLLGRIASVIPVPREKDFGVDLYFQPLIPVGSGTETVSELGSIQVKGGSQKLSYGGVSRGKWREYHFSWLRSLATPLYLARVNSDRTAVDLYSLWPLWLVFWPLPVSPFEVVLTPQPASSDPHVWQDPQPTPDPTGTGKGDGMRWAIDLGPAFLRLTSENVNDASFRDRAVRTLRTWIKSDRLILMRYLQFVPALAGITKWRTEPPGVVEEVRQWHFWDPRPGANIARVCQTVAPALVNLGIHLQWQDNWAAYSLIPALDWLDGEGYLDVIGKGLLTALRETQERNVGPVESVPEAQRPAE